MGKQRNALIVKFQFAETQSVFLDVIRFILAAIVVAGHAFGFFLGYFDGFFPEVFPYPQSIAVVCFFYLSGYLIVGSQIGRNRRFGSGIAGYFFERSTRVYVTLIPCLAFVAVFDFTLKKYFGIRLELVDRFTGIDVAINNLLLIPSMPFGTMRPIWSLMYEWWIYLLFGGLYHIRGCPLIATPLVFAGAYYTFMVNGAGEAGHIWIIWLVGGICAVLRHRIKWHNLNAYLMTLFSIIFFVLAMLIYFIYKDAYNLFAGVSLSLFLFVLTNFKNRYFDIILLIRKPAKYLAGLSFTLFLTHYTVLTYIKYGLNIEEWNGFLLGISISISVAFFIAFFTEYRLAAIRNFIKTG
jgi:peptidoglycan/LPS O-acetylase OafA/YrhL